jgi:molybdopterin synthase sulfur carrier subunit
MATVWIPSLMRDLTARQQTLDAPGKTVGQVIEALDVAYPGLKDRLCEGNRIRPTLAAHVDGRIAQLGLLEPVGEHSEIQFLPTVSGG